MKKTISVLMLTCLLAFAGSAGAVMSSGSGFGMPDSSGTMGTFMQMPTDKQMFEYSPITNPVTGTDISTTMPIGVGPVAMGGDMITVNVALGEFSGPMDMYLTVYAPAVKPFTIFLVQPDGTLKPASMGIEPWMTGVTDINEAVTNMPTSSLEKGTYTLGLMATPTGGNRSTYYMWTTHFVVQ